MQTFVPPEASLDEVDRLNHRVEDVLRTFSEVFDVVCRTDVRSAPRILCRTRSPLAHAHIILNGTTSPARRATTQPIVVVAGAASAKLHIQRDQWGGYNRTPNETSHTTAVGGVRHCPALLPRRWLQ
jgi:hypothetical protein